MHIHNSIFYKCLLYVGKTEHVCCTIHSEKEVEVRTNYVPLSICVITEVPSDKPGSEGAACPNTKETDNQTMAIHMLHNLCKLHKITQISPKR